MPPIQLRHSRERLCHNHHKLVILKRAGKVMTMSAPVAVVDTLNSLLEAELNSAFRFMGEGSPHLSRATADVRRPLAEMVVAEQRRAARLAHAIEALGGVPNPQPAIRDEEQFLAYLSL